ncbi:MAG: Ig-like domain-containing protein [Thermoplasmatota archaeon]
MVFLVLFTAVIVSIAVIPHRANAHAPGSVTLSYNYSQQNLSVTISHSVSSPTSHYVKTVTIYKNSVQVNSYSYTSQPTSNTFTYYYNVAASDGDTLSAKADCNIGGSTTGSTTASAPDETDPSVMITSPSNGTEVTSETLMVSGTASDNKGIDKVQVKVNEGNWVDASGKTTWTRQVSLVQGNNTIYAKAIDTSDNQAETSISVVYNATPPPDETPPTVSILSPSDGSQFDVDSITISGSASDNEDVAKVEIRVNQGAWTTAAGTVSWSLDVSLIEGSNKIEARATDTSDNTGSDVINVTYSPSLPPDTEPPTITIEAPVNDAVVSMQGITVSGTASDNRGVSLVEVRLNSGSWNSAAGTTSWSIRINLIEGENTVEVRAADDAGNTGAAFVDVTYDPGEPPDTEKPVVSIESPVEGAVFNIDSITVSGTASDNSCTCRVEVNVNGGNLMMATGRQSWSIDIILEEGDNFITARATDDSGNVGFDSVTVQYEILEPVDATAPEISITSPSSGTQTAEGRIEARGTASDEKGIEKVEIKLNEGSWRIASGTSTWSIALDLIEGENSITARATDIAGNQKEVTVTITYNIPYLPGSLDGVVISGEYSHKRSFDNGEFTVHWDFDGDLLLMGLEANTTGWISIGFGPSTMMKDADMIIGWVDDQDRVYVIDAYSTGENGPHPPDEDLGGTDDITDFGGGEVNGVTTIEFTRSANSTDLYDENLFPDQIIDIIWGYSDSDEFDGYHDLNRGYVEDFEFNPAVPGDGDDDEPDDGEGEGDDESEGGITVAFLIIIVVSVVVVLLIIVAAAAAAVILFRSRNKTDEDSESST